MVQTDRLAILIATYNGAAYLREQLDSLLRQSCAGWVTFVHDDGSKDDTVQILREYAENDPEHFVILDGPSQGGAKKNFMYLTRQVEAPYYMCCDQDDVWLEQKISATFGKMCELEKMYPGKPVLAFTDLKVVDRELRVLEESMGAYQNLDYENLSFARLMTQNVVSGCTMMMNRALRDAMLRVKNIDNVIMHDWWAAVVAAKFGTVGFVSEGTMLYRQHETNVVGAHSAKGVRQIAERLLHIQDMRDSIEATRKQAQELVESFGLEANDVASLYVRAPQMNRLKRWRFYSKNGVGKNGLLKNLAFYLLG